MYWLHYFEVVKNEIEMMDDAEFSKFSSIKKAANVLKFCIKVVLVLDEKEKETLFKNIDCDEEKYKTHEIKIPDTRDKLLTFVAAFPVGASLIHRDLYTIIDHSSFSLFKMVDSVPMELYKTIAENVIGGVIEKDRGIDTILHTVHSMYHKLLNMYSYHKKNNWDTFHSDYDAITEECIFNFEE